jgi:hypothetical protein
MMGINNVHVETSLGEIKTIENVLFVLRLRKSLMSIGSVANQGYYVVLMIKNASSSINTFIRW